MDDETNRPTGFVKWSLIFGGWMLFAVFFGLQSYVTSAYFGRPVTWGGALSVWLICACIWATLTPFVIWLARRFPVDRIRRWRNLGVHLLAGALISMLQLAIYIFARQLLLPETARPFAPLDALRRILVSEFHANLLIYLTIIGLCHAYEYYVRYRERERRAAQLELDAAQLETQLAQAQLDALRMQMQPHFLFNTLNTINVLMQEDVQAAQRMLVRLSELLRLALQNTNTHEVSLRHELEFLRSYLEIEQTRFQDRLTVTMDVEDDALDAQVPNLLLQPLVENAIKHGIAPRAEAGTVLIRAARVNGYVELQVRDNGPGIKDAAERFTNGIGLSNTRARLERLYGGASSFALTDADGGGLQVTISIPYHSAPRTK
ncbi:MAG: sensor histidine kinase [Pyrinomonadaceae bacterium]